MPAQPAPGPNADVTSANTTGTGAAGSGGDGQGLRPRVRALRGATTVDDDNGPQVIERTQVLLKTMLARNGVEHRDIISVFFTATDDVHSMFPATAARGIGFGDVPLICARELDIEGSQPRCIRVMMHIETTREKLHHIYLEGARGLRDDLPG